MRSWADATKAGDSPAPDFYCSGPRPLDIKGWARISCGSGPAGRRDSDRRERVRRYRQCEGKQGPGQRWRLARRDRRRAIFTDPLHKQDEIGSRVCQGTQGIIGHQVQQPHVKGVAFILTVCFAAPIGRRWNPRCRIQTLDTDREPCRVAPIAPRGRRLRDLRWP